MAGPPLGEMVTRPSAERLSLPVTKPSRTEKAGIATDNSEHVATIDVDAGPRQ